MFLSREQAAELLAQQLKEKGYGGENTIVLAIPRGGVVTGRVVADALGAPLDIVITRKIPAPHQPELALGAVGPEGVRIVNWETVAHAGVDEEYIDTKSELLEKEIAERERLFRGGKPALDVNKKVVMVTDDGVATGATVEAAVAYLGTKNPSKIVVAVPVASQDAVMKLTPLVDEMVVLESPEDFGAVGQFYRQFPQVTDEEVIEILRG
ncbi:phosphoribosyltransferase [Candidatus Microgenomates bacterium]|nr:phosphoribosyltransferase [Candidatus Microgenomates bacterium]